MSETAFPLSWPRGWPRCERRKRSLFQRNSMDRATRFLSHEVRLLQGANGLIVSTNVRLRNDGLPYSGQAQPVDPGAAIYFTLKERPVSLACDKWDRVEDNVYAIAKHIEALRGQERWGVGTLEQAFAGFMALPWKKIDRDPYDVLGLPKSASIASLKSAFKELAKEFHPDNGGSDEAMAELNNAFEKIVKEKK